jgi:hypothetical protein
MSAHFPTLCFSVFSLFLFFFLKIKYKNAWTCADTAHLVLFRWARFTAAQTLLRFTRLRGHARTRADRRFLPSARMTTAISGAALDVGDHVSDRDRLLGAGVPGKLMM